MRHGKFAGGFFRFAFAAGLVLSLILLAFGCDRFRDEHQIADAFGAFMKSLQDRNLDEIEEMIHPDSPFLEAYQSISLRQTFWESQLMRLSMIGGYMETESVEPENDQGVRQLVVELTPKSQDLGSMDIEVPFKNDNGQWKLLLPKSGIELVPINFSDYRPEFGPYKSQDGNMSYEMKVEHVDGYSQDDWLKVIRDNKDKQKQTGQPAQPETKKSE